MVRIFGFLVGVFFAGWLLVSFAVGAYSYVSDPPQETAEHWVEERFPQPKVAWSFNGPFGKYDLAQLQRGFQVYSEVCSGLPFDQAGRFPRSQGAWL